MNDFWNNIPTVFRGEATVELRLVIPLLHALGFDDCDIDSKYPVTFQEGRNGRHPEADFVCFKGATHGRDTSLLVVEVKNPEEALAGGKAQGESYAANLRAPFLLLINGKDIEVWQYQPTKESERVLSLSVASLQAERGTVERLLSKSALCNYCKSLCIKTIAEAIHDYHSYIQAELNRVAHNVLGITRTLQQADGSTFETTRLLVECPEGAIVLAPSGYGKTTLSNTIFHQALQDCQQDPQKRLPFEISLPDFEHSGQSLVEFINARLSAHCAGVSAAFVNTLLHNTGTALLCDGFERTTIAFRPTLIAAFKNLIRDHPCVQIFLFSRTSLKQALALPEVILEPLSYEQMRALVRKTTGDSDLDCRADISFMPHRLKELSTNPLLLKLTLDYKQKTKEYPREIKFLFQSWLEKTLCVEPDDPTSSAYREEALSLLAVETSNAPITAIDAIKLLKQHELPLDIYNQLVACGAIIISGSTIELQHEALADYLRARNLARMPEEEILSRLSKLSLPDASFFPVLLMAQLQNHKLQTALWKRFSELDLGIYLDALRYRFDLSKELEALNEDDLSKSFLSDLIDAIDGQLDNSFSELREPILEDITGNGTATLAITGCVSPKSLCYQLHSKEPHQERVTVGAPIPPASISCINLDLAHYRIDSARLVGITLLRDSVFETIGRQQLNGGPLWAAERLLGRVRYLAKMHGLDISITDSLDKLENSLKPFVGKMVCDGHSSSQERFSIQSLIDDITTLRMAGTDALDPWWSRLGWEAAEPLQKEDNLRRILDEEYRRVQIALGEVVPKNFPAFADQISSYTRLPIRWKLTVKNQAPRPVLFYRWLPVSTWDEAGADVSFTDCSPKLPDWEEVAKALANLNRPNSRIGGIGGWRLMPSFRGNQWNGRFDGGSPVIHEVCSLLEEEFKSIFDPLPGNDGFFQT